MDDDDAGRSAAKKFVKKLGVKRCVIVKPIEYRDEDNSNSGGGEVTPQDRPKDANDALRNPNVDMIRMIEEVNRIYI